MRTKFIIGVDLGGTNIKVGLLDLHFKIIQKQIQDTRKFNDKEDLIAAIVSCVNKIISTSALAKKNILALGMGLPGPVDASGGIVHFLPNIPGWREVKLKKILESKLGLSVFLDNDVKVMTLAEQKMGAARGFKNTLCITLGTGVGGGLILGGRLYRGQDNAAGEIGHLPINVTGPRCNCGGIACLEAYVGNVSIERLARSKFGHNLSPLELSQKARSGNKAAIGIWSKVAVDLGVALTAAVNLLNLDAIIIGGGVSQAGSILFDGIRKTIDRRAMSVQSARVKVLRAKLGADAGIIGAAILAREELN